MKVHKQRNVQHFSIFMFVFCLQVEECLPILQEYIPHTTLDKTVIIVQ